MAWPIPPTAGVDLQSSAFLMQFWKALQERSRALGKRFWPLHNFDWRVADDPEADGIITSVSHGTGPLKIYDNTADWTPNRWTNNDGDNWKPSSYDVVIQLGTDFEPERHVRFLISGNEETELTLSPSDWIERGIIASYDELDGKQYYIIRDDGFWWNDRWPEPPNATILNFGIIGTSTTSTITDVEASKFPPGSLVGSDVIWFAGGLLKRSTVTSNAVPVAQVWKGTIGTTTNGHTYILTLTDPDGGTVPIGITVANPPDTTTTLVATKLINAWNASSDPRIAAITATQDGAQVILTADQPGYGFVVVASGTGTWTGTGNTTANVPSFTFSPAAANRPNDDLDYLIIPEDGKWYSGFTVSASTTQPSGYNINTGNWNFKWGCWYRGLMEQTQYSNDANNDLIPAYGPAAEKIWSEGVWPLSCGPESHSPTMDVDLYSGDSNQCDFDTLYAPDLFKTFRQIQLQIIAFSYNFVEPKSYDGEKEIVEMKPARLFNVASVNGFTSTVDSATSSQIVLASTTNFGAENYPLRVYFVIIREDGTTRGQPGEGSLDDTDVLAPDGGVPDWDNPDDPIEGCTVILSPGFTRYFPRRVRYMYPKTCFIPEINDDGEYRDPTEEYPGQWVTRSASEEYAEYGNLGILTESAHAFVSGDLVRYVGENFDDPTIPIDVTDEALAGYHQNFFEGRSRPNVQVQIDAARRGSVTASALHWMEDSTKSWWSVPPFGQGELGAGNGPQSGTATGGGSTTLTDATKTGNGFWEKADWFIGFILKITKAVGGAVYYVPITGQNTSTLTLSFNAVAGLTVASGDSYEIAVPKYELNRWRGRTVRFYLEDGPLDVAITHSDDTRLYFAPMASPIPTDATDYEILEKQPGTTWRWNGSSFEQPTGTDSRAGIAFPEDQTAIPPTKVKRYGPMMKGDYISHTEFFAEMYRCINKLVWTKKGVGWTADEEYNFKAASSEDSGYDDHYDFPSPPYAYANYATAATAYRSSESALWAALVQGDNSFEQVWQIVDTPPRKVSRITTYAAYDTGVLQMGSISDVATTSSYAYATVADVPNIMSSSVDWFAKAIAPLSNVYGDGITTAHNGPSYFSSAPMLLVYDCEWNSNGDDVRRNEFSLFDSDGPSNDPLRRSNVLGDFDQAASSTPVNPAVESPGGSTDTLAAAYLGYIVTEGVAVVKWNVSGGFMYV